DEAEEYVFYSGFHNEGEISASASGYSGSATGVYIDTNYVLIAYNDGEISATAEGANTQATGFMGGSHNYGANLVNTGTISATADYQATGVWLGSQSYTNLYNYGLIEASGAAYN